VTLVGYLGENAPRANFLNVVGRPKVKELGQADTYVGEFAKAERDNLCFPIERGIIKDWGDIETVWYHNFYNELREDPTEHPVLITESALNTQHARQESAKLMFEIFDVPSISFVDQSLCTLLAAELKTGVVVEFGHGLTQIVSIKEGKKIKKNTFVVPLGGIDLARFGNSADDKLNCLFENKDILKYILQSLENFDGPLVIGGGVSGLTGLKAKLESEVKKTQPTVKIISSNSAKPHFSAYVGASVLADFFPEFLEANVLTRDEFSESGVQKFNL
jgi:actin-related protein